MDNRLNTLEEFKDGNDEFPYFNTDTVLLESYLDEDLMNNMVEEEFSSSSVQNNSDLNLSTNIDD